MGEFIMPDWLKNQDAETIHRRMMARLPPDIDDTEGGFPWDFTKPTALEKAELLQFHLVETLKIMFPEWSYGEYLDLHAKRVALERRAAGYAYAELEIEGIAGTVIPAGFAFAVPSVNSQPAIEFRTMEAAEIAEDGKAAVGVLAVLPGTSGNVPADAIVLMVSPMRGITAIKNPEKASGGTEEESDDSLRARIMEIEQGLDTGFVGCDADYIRWAKEVPGVGNPFVIANWDPAVKNSVKLVVLDSNGEPANDHILELVYDHIISPGNRLNRKAPIGAILTVVAPVMKEIAYSLSASLMDGYDAAAVADSITASIQQYYIKAKDEGLVQYIKIHAIIAQTPGIYDFTHLTMNGDVENIAIALDEYPGTVSIDLGIPREVGE